MHTQLGQHVLENRSASGWQLRKLSHIFLLAGFMVCLSLPALAHHGGGVEWQDGVQGPITGTATAFEFRFPHVVIRMEVATDSGVEHWALTTRWTPTILRQHGWSRNSVKPGDSLTATYVPHVTDPNVVQMRTILVNGNELPLQF